MERREFIKVLIGFHVKGWKRFCNLSPVTSNVCHCLANYLEYYKVFAVFSNCSHKLFFFFNPFAVMCIPSESLLEQKYSCLYLSVSAIQ